MQWLAPLPHNENIPGSIPRLVVGPFCVDLVRIFSGYSGPRSHILGELMTQKLTLGVSVSEDGYKKWMNES